MGAAGPVRTGGASRADPGYLEELGLPEKAMAMSEADAGIQTMVGSQLQRGNAQMEWLAGLYELRRRRRARVCDHLVTGATPRTKGGGGELRPLWQRQLWARRGAGKRGARQGAHHEHVAVQS